MNSAWHNNLHAEVGLHFGELQEAQEHGAQALVTYQLAAASTSHIDMRGVRQPPTPLQRDLEARIIRLTKIHPQSALKDPEEALRDLLKLKAGPSTGQTLVAPYRLLITAAGVQMATALGTIDGDHGKPDLSRDLSRLKRRAGKPGSTGLERPPATLRRPQLPPGGLRSDARATWRNPLAG